MAINEAELLSSLKNNIVQGDLLWWFYFIWILKFCFESFIVLQDSVENYSLIYLQWIWLIHHVIPVDNEIDRDAEDFYICT